MSKVKLGIIGLGAMGQRLIQTIIHSHSDTIEITAVCDSSESLTKQVAEELQVTNYTTDYHVLLNNEEIQLIYIAVPPKFHERIVLDAVQKHILCEKPLANSLEEAGRMLEAVERENVLHMMNFPLNYQGAMYKMMELLEDGYIGKYRRIDLTLHFPKWPRSWQKNSWVGKREQGGFMLEVGAHWIQFILKNFGQILHIKGDVHYPEDPNASESGVIATLTLENDIKVHVNGLSQMAGNERVELAIHGTEGSVMIENWGTLKAGKSGEAFEEIPIKHKGNNRLLDHVVAAIKGEKADIYDFRIGYNVQVVLEAFKQQNLQQGIDLKNKYK
ncbi:Gfo/Idh/MocA family protein [Bacillus salitolerans]|uniref:Gfo/Idh/MocA family protein n=1 Tax=Bacillus salitolerans TaxID=1437434 RepID=A0ABW4LSR1_9BACI